MFQQARKRVVESLKIKGRPQSRVVDDEAEAGVSFNESVREILDKIFTQKALNTWCFLLDPGWELITLKACGVIWLASIEERSVTAEASIGVQFAHLGRVRN